MRPRRRRRSLRKTVVLAFVPLVAVGGIGMAVVLRDVRHVNGDLQRMFEELREVALSRSLLDELHGIEQWVTAVPEETAATQELVKEDLFHHLDAASETFGRFVVVDDPSLAEHDAEEQRVLRRLGDALQAMREALRADRPIAELQAPLSVALHGAGVMSATVEHESRAVGNGLDQRARWLGEFVLLFGLATGVVVSWLAVLLLRRVLVPVRDLRQVVEDVGAGRPETVVAVRHDDELGELAESFMAMAAQVRQSREELERRVEQRSREVLRTARLAELGSLAAGIAHEINNPIASIAACAEGLLRQSRDGEVGERADLLEYLEIIRKEAMRTRDITARLLRFARHDTGVRERVWLGAELHEVAPMFSHQFADAGVELRLECDPRGPAILGDASEWRQVLFNLLRNALDVSPRGSTVEVRCHDRDGMVRLEVADHGGGIRAEDMDRIFEPFFTTKPPGKGTGLGLAIVHRIVTGHGGEIAVENLGDGATFVVRMPRVALGL